MVVAVLGVAHVVFALWNYWQLSSQHELRIRSEMEARPQEFDALVEQAGLSLGELALLLASSHAAIVETQGSAGLASAETFGGILSLAFFDQRGEPLGAWEAPGSGRPANVPGYERAVRSVLSQSQPTLLVSCAHECLLTAFVPFLSDDGESRVIVVGQALSETLVAFRRLNGANAAILGERVASDSPADASGALWGRSVLAVTNAPFLLPLLAQLRVDKPPAATLIRATAGGRSLRLSLESLPRTAQRNTEILFIADETDAIAAIREQIERGITLNGLTLLLSVAAVFLLLTPALRRLSDVTSALPLLAEHRFDATRERLQIRGVRHRPDEIEVLRDAALALSHRLEILDGAEAASEEKSRFLATMSHEIRTPMNGILGLLELLEGDNLSADQMESIRIARDSGRTLLGVIDGILDFSRLEAAQFELERIPFKLAEVVEDAVETLAPSARSKNLRLTVFVDPFLPRQVVGDPLRMRQVLFNLCSNAIKFTAHGSVQVRVESLGDPGSRGEARVRFHVVDSGIGLPDTARARLFRPFVQGDSTTTRRFGGTGLGLSIVRGLVTRMGGSVDFSSAEGRGSDFWVDLVFPVVGPVTADESSSALAGIRVTVDLPDRLEAGDLDGYLKAAGADVRPGGDALVIREAPEQAHWQLEIHGGALCVGVLHRPVRVRQLVRQVLIAAGRDATEPSPARAVAYPPRTDGPAVLVAEDHLVNQQVIERQLLLLGYRPSIVGDGLEALERLRTQTYDALLADLHMPNMDGLQLTTAIRAEERSGRRAHRLPIIALTAAALSSEREDAHAAGMDDFLLKPAGLAQLHDVLKRFIPPRVAGIVASGPLSIAPASSIGDDRSPAPIDRDLLLDLVGGDASFADHLMEEFIRLNAPVVASLATLLEAPWNAEAVRVLAHRLHGSARTVAATEMAVALGQLEGAAKDDRATLALEIGRTVLARFETVRRFVADEDDGA